MTRRDWEDRAPQRGCAAAQVGHLQWRAPVSVVQPLGVVGARVSSFCLRVLSGASSMAGTGGQLADLGAAAACVSSLRHCHRVSPSASTTTRTGTARGPRQVIEFRRNEA